MKRIGGMIALAAAIATLGACGSKKQSDGGVTAEESAGLNNAADMLDTSPDSLTAPEQAPLGNGDVTDNAATGEGAAVANGAAAH